jgi:exopolysaccharide biosynthesis polyprenyl glycosylphosphotransferase
MATDVNQIINTPHPTASIGLGGMRQRRISLPSLRLRTSERKLLLWVADALAINGALLLALLLRTEFIASVRDVLALGKWFVTLSLVWLACALFFGCYSLARATSTFHSVRSSGLAALVTTLVYILVPWFTPPLHSRSLILIFGALGVGSIVAWRVTYAQLFVQPRFEQRALVVGAGRAGQRLIAALRTASTEDNPFRCAGYRLIGFVDDNPDYVGTEVEGVPVLGGGETLVSLAQELKVDMVILAITHHHAITDDLFDALLRCRELGLQVTTMSVLYERLLGRVPVEHVGRDLYMVVPREETAAERLYRVAKRGLDILSALVGLPVLGLLLPLVALGNALTSPGPLFFRQRRVGKGGRSFDMFKLRSMVPGAEQGTGAVWACRDDDRITLLGRILRRARLDELPQFINILRGEMSLIGPRPERPEFVDILAQDIPFYRARHAVKPGLTGWAQVRYGYCNSSEDAKVKLEHDLYYIKHADPFLDLSILLQTIPATLRLEGC